MKISLTILFLQSLIISTPNIIILKEYYKGYGVIFDEKSFKDPSTISKSYKVYYKPNIDIIIKTEQFIQNNYYQYNIDLNRSLNNGNVTNPKYKKPKFIKNKFYNFNRQYYGYINFQNDTIIVTYLMNFKNKNKAEKYFKNWDKMPILGFGDWYYKNQKIIHYNITKNKFELNLYKETNVPSE